jgi:hypothetical protein
MAARAKSFAERLRREAGDELRARVVRAFEVALSRAPVAAELADAEAYLSRSADPALFERFCLVLLNLNEFVYVE